MIRWIVHVIGLDDPSGYWYMWWSGFGADLSMFVGVGVWYRHRNCHARGCWRLGRYPTTDGPWMTCRRHHS